jgi:hypothetical protein
MQASIEAVFPRKKNKVGRAHRILNLATYYLCSQLWMNADAASCMISNFNIRMYDTYTNADQ